MPIPVTCPSCAAAFNVKDEHAGKRGKCPKCKAELTVPSPFRGGDTVRMPAPRPKPKPKGDAE